MLKLASIVHNIILETESILVGLAKTVYIHTVYDRIFGYIPAKNTVYTPYIYGPGQP